MRVLAIGCHPDDLEISCGGTLAKYVKLGHCVVMCHIANGNMGHALIMPEELKKIRKNEALEAGKILGADEVISIDVDDLTVDSGCEVTVKKVIEVIRHVRPDIIITHYTEDYMKDHIETSKIVFDASFSSSIPHYETKTASYPDIVPVYYMDTIAGVGFLPEDYVDISDTIELKLEALNKHQSQIKWMREHDGIDFLDFVRTVSKFRGLQCNRPYAEGYRKLKVWPRLGLERLLP